MWVKISDFARSLGVSEDFISKATMAFNDLIGQFSETDDIVRSEYTEKECENSLSMQNFYPWAFEQRLICFYMLYLSGFRHTALRELRFYLELSARGYYIDTNFDVNSYEDKVSLLKIFMPKKLLEEKDKKSLGILLGNKKYRKPQFEELVANLPKKGELSDFYKELCNYVHLSEITQTEARDPSLNRALIHRLYVEDKEMLEKTFGYSKYLLLRALEREHKQLSNSRKLPPQKPKP